MTDDQYYLRREQDERARAAQCDDRAVRAIHLELADRYASRGGGNGSKLKLVPTAP